MLQTISTFIDVISLFNRKKQAETAILAGVAVSKPKI
jgi:hypothetical protein